ncbi:MAG: molybdopterin molybdotransferase MoeA [Deltaproteobacteria bacterium]|nr:molybdopterin molybdotransferase MoeA [Deltaproteobacteria bacterium]
MISIQEALDIIQANLPEPASQECFLEQALGKHLAADLEAPEPSPRYTNSAMDGFAVRWEDIAAATAEAPVTLELVGESRAGHPYAGQVGPGQAIRISTGAVFGNGCDTVVKVEDTSEAGEGAVSIRGPQASDQNIRYAGEEFQAGDMLLRRGAKVNAAAAALLAAVGQARVQVYRPARVAVLVTGSELVAVGEAIADYQIRDSNMIMLQAAALEAGAAITAARRISDELPATQEAIGAVEADIILCSGGVSMGKHDHVKEAAEANGFERLFWRIRQKPGKPLYLAKKGNTLLFGLPGNPVSAFLCFIHYVRPVITAMKGLPFGYATLPGRAAVDIHNRGKRDNMIRGRVVRDPQGCYAFTPLKKQNSHMLTSLTGGNGYIVLAPNQALPAGSECEIYRYDFSDETI